MAKRLTQTEKDARIRSRQNRRQKRILGDIFEMLNADNTDRLKHIDKDAFDAAREESLQVESDDDDDKAYLWGVVFTSSIWSYMIKVKRFAATGHFATNARDWHALFNDMTPVQKLVHMAKRYAIDETSMIKSALLRLKRRAYEGELTIQANHVGCARQGHLTNEYIMADLEVASRDSSESVSNTYNYDLAVAIQKISGQNPYANRNYYAKHLGLWETARDAWKVGQIQQYESGVARAQAQKDFYTRNRHVLGTAVLRPKKAVCPICQGWIDRGVVALRVALNNPPPYHVGCPHVWQTRPNRVRKEECPLLWMGGD